MYYFLVHFFFKDTYNNFISAFLVFFVDAVY